MIRRIPKDKYKRVKIGKNIEAVGYKSETYDYNGEDGFNSPKLNNEAVSLVIRTNYDVSDFEFRIRDRKNLLKLKEAIDFALEIKEENKNG